MVVILPDKRGGLRELVEELAKMESNQKEKDDKGNNQKKKKKKENDHAKNTMGFDFVFSRLNSSVPVTVDLELPKFQLEYSLDLRQALDHLGLGSIFGGKKEPDFGGMLEDSKKKLVVSKMVHR